MKKHVANLWLAALLVLLATVAGLLWEHEQTVRLAASVESLQQSVGQLASGIAQMEYAASTTAAATAANIAELSRRQNVETKSQDQLLQDAVAAVTPSVVSIVESKEVAKLQVSYENPFGNDPFFQGFGVQVPVYRQVGTTTEQVGAGTGFIVRANGYIVTNKHVVPDTNASYSVLLASGKQESGTVVWRSPTEDLAVVKIPGTGYDTIALGNSSTVKLGESVFAVGNALGQYNNSVSVGVVSGLNRTITANDAATGQAETLTGVIQTDAAINPGNSGGPLVNLEGQAVGVNVATVQGSQNIGFSLPIAEVKAVLASLGI
ncbi:MAG: trypsin-like peptidase domain-containing protein [Patescibacteria group bacterium]|nr:trypsin-like peptidase domain-containing protein [Patescibacteria group bacterium]MDE1965957.1 trypsin-like peptidase domain-containing protein [Patescibacteria group bacterium]